jgi:hypothetical protein
MERHIATFYLRGHHEVTVEVSNLETTITEEGVIASYKVETVPKEHISYLFFQPEAIVGIKAVLIESGDEEDNLESE